MPAATDVGPPGLVIETATSSPTARAPVIVIEGSVDDQSAASNVTVTPSLKTMRASVAETRRADIGRGRVSSTTPSPAVARGTCALPAASSMPVAEWSE